MTNKSIERSFAGGEIAPLLAARFDLAKNQTGLSLCRNAWTLPYGPMQNRPGLEYVLEVKDSTKKTRLIPFAYSTTQTMVIEIGAGYFRFHTQAGNLLEAAGTITAITNANPGVVSHAAHGYTTGQVVYLLNTGMPNLNGRYCKVTVLTTGTYSLQDLGGTNINTTSYGTFVSGTAQRVYEVTNSYAEADLFDIHYAQSNDVLSLVHPTYPPAELRRLGATNWQFANISFAPTIAAPSAPTVVPNAAGGTTYTYVVTAIASDGLEESLASASTVNAACQVLTTAGAFNTITPPAVSGAIRYNVYKLISGLYGYIGQTDGSGFVDNNITPDTSKTPAINDNPFGSSGNYPGAVGYFEGRRWFAGTTNKPQSTWATKSGTESNMSYSIPTRDSDRIAFTIKARENNTIRHMIAMSDMMLLTAGGEWRLGTQNSDILTPTSVSPKPQAYEGANNAQPVLAGDNIVYASARGGHVRELTQSPYQSQIYDSHDLSLMAPHLFDGYTVTDMAVARAPFKIIWCVRSDGTLLSCTYLPEQQIVAWHQHDSEDRTAVFESVAVVNESGEDYLYVIVKRSVNGRTVRYVERMRSRRFATLADTFIVDSGLTYSGASTSTVTGLWHLEGKTVKVLLDGGTHPDCVVSGGAITLQNPGTKAQVGLGIVSQGKDLPLSAEAEALGQGLRKNVNGVYVRVVDSSGLKFGPAFDKLTEYRQRTNEPYGSPPALINDEVHIEVKPKWNSSGQVCWQMTDPLPFTIMAITKEVAIGG